MSVSGEDTPFEVKFPLNTASVGNVRALLDAYCVPDVKYPVGIVSSLYFDTRDRHSLEEKRSGASTKHTYRLRWYQQPVNSGHGNDMAFLEVKQRQGAARRKRRIALSLTGSQVEELDPESPEMISICQQFQKLYCTGPAVRRVLWPILRVDYLRLRYVDRQTLGRCNLDLQITAMAAASPRIARHLPVVLNGGVFEYKGDTPQLPPTLRILSRIGLKSGSFSKYAICSRLISSLSDGATGWQSLQPVRRNVHELAMELKCRNL